MKHLKFLLLILFAFPQLLLAQNPELINSGEVIKNCAALYDSGQYKTALPLLNKINRSDTNYVWSLYEKAIDCEADSQYVQAIKYCRDALALKQQREYEPDFYNTYGNALSDMGKPDDALKVFDSAIAKYPAYSLLYFNKGIVMLQMKRDHDAELLFEQTLLINPYMYSAHYQLGLAALHQGKLVPAYLSFIGYLLMNPNGKYAARSINMLSQIATGTDEIMAYKNSRTITPDDNYQAVEDIWASKIALDKQYKPSIALDDPISRQIQACFEKLEYSDTNTDFWIQYYLPFFRQEFTGGKFEPFINHIFSHAQVASIQDYNKKNKKALDGLFSDAEAYFDLVRATREPAFKKRGMVTVKYLFEKGKLLGKGTTTADGKSLTGAWLGYYVAGNIRNKGSFNAGGERDGEWIFYNNAGNMNGKERYINGKLQGAQEYYFDNGNLSSTENYTDGKLNGLATGYYYDGNKRSLVKYLDGKKTGEERKYYSDGSLRVVNNFTADVQTGASQAYYKNGKIKEVEQYIDGKADGDYKGYSQYGVLTSAGAYSKDKATGPWTYFYDSGKIKEKHNYVNDQEEGPHEEYYETGELSLKATAKKGYLDGECDIYYKDGKLLSKYIYNNGVIKSATYFSEAGTALSASELKDGIIDIVTYNFDGLKRAHERHNAKGDLEGSDTIFYASGKIQEINQYKDGQPNGPSVAYYLNGNKKSEVNMTDGKNDGYYRSYHNNGHLEMEGWITDGDNQGEWKNYDEKGRLTTTAYYLDGDFDGYKDEIEADGKLSIEQKYHRGWLEEMTQYDDSGNVLTVDSFPKTSGKFMVYYRNKQVMIKSAHVNGDLNGPYKSFYFDGSAEASFFYKKGQMDSTYVSYYYGGVKESEGRYKDGNRIGTWKNYDEDGKLESVFEYAADGSKYTKTWYFANGNKDFFGEYKDDELDGMTLKYAPDGAAAYQVKFENGNAKSYAYPGADGKLVPFIPIRLLNGPLKSFYANGKPSRECYYTDGIKNGRDVLYFNNGQVWQVDTVAYSATQGISREYYPNGKIKTEYHYATGNLDGIAREFDENGILKKETIYDNGEINGPAKYYDKSGKLVKTMMYYYGKLISVKNG